VIRTNNIWYRRSLPRGDTLRIDYQVTQMVDNTEVVVDLTGSTLTYSCKVRPTSSTYVFPPLTIGSGITLVDAPNGKLRIEVPSSVTDTLAPGEYYTDLEMVSSGGAKTTIFREILQITYDITRP